MPSVQTIRVFAPISATIIETTAANAQIRIQRPCEPFSDIFTHYLHFYPAKLLPYIPAFFLSDEALIGKKAKVLDPFAGSRNRPIGSSCESTFTAVILGCRDQPFG